MYVAATGSIHGGTCPCLSTDRALLHMRGNQGSPHMHTAANRTNCFRNARMCGAAPCIPETLMHNHGKQGEAGHYPQRKPPTPMPCNARGYMPVVIQTAPFVCQVESSCSKRQSISKKCLASHRQKRERGRNSSPS